MNEALLKANCDPNIVGENGNTPLHITCINHHYLFVSSLIENSLIDIMIPPRHILLVLAEFFYSLAEILTSKIFGPGPKGPGPIISKSYYDY